MDSSNLDWNYEHVRTLIYWLNIANVNIFLLDASIQYYKKLITRVMAVTLLFSSLSTTVSLSQLGLDEKSYSTALTVIKYIFMATSAISTILMAYIKLFKLQEMMDANLEMHKEWLDFATKISGELQMPIQLRKQALTLLKDLKSMYIGLFCKRPFISDAVQRYATKYFDTQDANIDANTYYIKRTNVFFVFQDIMKNEIKRLATEIESQTDLPNVRIDYEHDGPFIVIRITNKEHVKFYEKYSDPRDNFTDTERVLYLKKVIAPYQSQVETQASPTQTQALPTQAPTPSQIQVAVPTPSQIQVAVPTPSQIQVASILSADDIPDYSVDYSDLDFFFDYSDNYYVDIEDWQKVKDLILEMYSSLNLELDMSYIKPCADPYVIFEPIVNELKKSKCEHKDKIINPKYNDIIKYIPASVRNIISIMYADDEVLARMLLIDCTSYCYITYANNLSHYIISAESVNSITKEYTALLDEFEKENQKLRSIRSK